MKWILLVILIILFLIWKYKQGRKWKKYYNEISEGLSDALKDKEPVLLCREEDLEVAKELYNDGNIYFKDGKVPAFIEFKVRTELSDEALDKAVERMMWMGLQPIGGTKFKVEDGKG